jgi:malate/lactate dehydrogenase
MNACDLPGYWNVWWVGYESEDRMEVAEGGIYDIHESDIVVVSAGIKKKNKE